MNVIAIIPAYNEGPYIGSVVLNTKEYVDRVVVVDDGSKDDTARIAELAGAIVIKHEQNKGYGASLKTCFDTAKKIGADIMVILDGDCQHQPSYIRNLIQPIMVEGFDVVIGSRFLNDAKNNIPLYRKFGMKILDFFTIYISKQKVSDSQSGFRAYSKRAIDTIKITNTNMAAGSEILISARQNNLKIKEIPISIRYDVGKPSQNPISHGISIIISLIKLIGEKHALLFFGSIGISIASIGLIAGVWVIKTYNTVHVLPIGTALISVLFTLMGFYLMSTGIILYVIGDIIKNKD